VTRESKSQKQDYIEFDCFEIKQPIGIFYNGVIDCSDVIDISFADIRMINQERRDVETYLGIERPLSPNRVKELKQYVNLIDAAFPTSIILAVESENAVYNPETSKMRIVRHENVAKILDGQHRIAGLEEYKNGPNSFQLNVTIFIDMDLDDQAMLFATINLKVTKVNKSLAYDLYEYSKTRSPQKSSHDIARLLNFEPGSPFKDKIKILGQAIDKEKETITQATFIESLMKYISKNPMQDRDALKRNKRLEKIHGPEERNLIFRNLFIEKKDAQIARIMWAYFSSVAETWPIAWQNTARGNILNRSTGFIVLMRFLRDGYLYIVDKNSEPSGKEFAKIFNRTNFKDNEFTSDNYKPGSEGQSKLYGDFITRAKLVRR